MRIATFSDFLAKMEASLNESRLKERQKRQQLRLMATLFGEPLGLSDPSIVKDKQFGLSSGRGGDLPRLDYSTWQPALLEDPEPFVEIDFQKPFVVRGLLLRSEKGDHYANLCIIKDVKIEFYDLSCARKTYHEGKWLVGNSAIGQTQLVSLPYPFKGMGIRVFLRGSLFMKCSMEILGDQVNLGEELDLDTGIYKRRTVDNNRTSHMIQPSFLTGVRLRISFLTEESCKVRQFSFFANDKNNKSKLITTFKAPKMTNTWVTYAFPTVVSTWSVQVEPKIDFQIGSDAVLRVKYQFLGYYDKGYSETTEDSIKFSPVK